VQLCVIFNSIDGNDVQQKVFETFRNSGRAQQSSYLCGGG
jgi:hypothetical protein